MIKKCPCCKRYKWKWWQIRRRRMNTQFCDDDKNFLTSCEDCAEATMDYYAELWSECYYN